MAEHFKIVFEGQLRTGVDPETARLNLAQLFKSDVSGIDRLFSDQPITLKHSLTHDDAKRYLEALHDAGVEGRIEPEQPVSWSLEEIGQPAPARPAFESAASPYAPPRATVAEDWPAEGGLKVFTVQGRIGRLRYLAWSMVLSFVALLLAALCIGVLSMSLIAGGLLGAIMVVAFIVVSVQIGSQRVHDAGWSAWLLLLNLVPVVGSFFPLMMVLVPGSIGPNRYGPPPPKNNRSVKILAVLWVAFITLVFVGAMVGGWQKLQEEIETTTGDYEQSLPYDDDSDEAAQPDVPADPAYVPEAGDSSDNTEDQ